MKSIAAWLLFSMLLAALGAHASETDAAAADDALIEAAARVRETRRPMYEAPPLDRSEPSRQTAYGLADGVFEGAKPSVTYEVRVAGSVSTSGELREPVVVETSGLAALDAAARASLLAGTYYPALRDGNPIEARYDATYTFRHEPVGAIVERERIERCARVVVLGLRERRASGALGEPFVTPSCLNGVAMRFGEVALTVLPGRGDGVVLRSVVGGIVDEWPLPLDGTSHPVTLAGRTFAARASPHTLEPFFAIDVESRPASSLVRRLAGIEGLTVRGGSAISDRAIGITSAAVYRADLYAHFIFGSDVALDRSGNELVVRPVRWLEPGEMAAARAPGFAERRARFAAVEAAYLEDSRFGSGAIVTIDRGGNRDGGEDHLVYGEPSRLRELRRHHELVSVGETFCQRHVTSDWTCTGSEVAYGLVSPDMSALRDLSIGSVDCEEAPACEQFELRFAREHPSGGRYAHAVDARVVAVVADAATHRPWRVVEREVDAAGVHAVAERRLTYGLVPAIELPAEASVQ